MQANIIGEVSITRASGGVEPFPTKTASRKGWGTRTQRVPVWVALPLVPDWRWLLDREDCPWYPSMRLFRQTKFEQWDDVLERMAEELMMLRDRRAEPR